MNPQQNMVFGGAANPQMGMMPGMMNPNMMNPGMMNPGMMNPGMMNPGMMNQGIMPGLPGMMNPNMMPWIIGMMPGMMPKAPLNEEQKRQLRIMGYEMGKKMALEKKRTLEAQKPKTTNTPANNQPQPAKGNITVNFKKGGSVTKVTKDAESMVAELIDDYFHKTNSNFRAIL